jgi:glutaminase
MFTRTLLFQKRVVIHLYYQMCAVPIKELLLAKLKRYLRYNSNETKTHHNMCWTQQTKHVLMQLSRIDEKGNTEWYHLT